MARLKSSARNLVEAAAAVHAMFMAPDGLTPRRDLVIAIHGAEVRTDIQLKGVLLLRVSF
jgi:hypothetical protein